MQNKLPIGQTAEATHVGGGGTGNDQLNKEALGGITHERKRPRYSIFAMAVNGPNFYSPAGVWDLLSGATTRRSQTTAHDAPYDFSGLTQVDLFVKVDGAAAVQEILSLSDVQDPENVTAEEVADNLTWAGATTSVVDGTKVKIESDDPDGSIEVVDAAGFGNAAWGFPHGTGATEPNRTSPGAGGSSFANGVGNSIEFEYEAREPIIFIGGQLFIGEVTSLSGGSPPDGATTIHVEKVEADSPFDVVTIDKHTHNHGPNKVGPDLDNKNILMQIPGSRSQFSNGERFRFRVVPNGDGYDVGTHGLRGVSAVLWFKALHR